MAKNGNRYNGPPRINCTITGITGKIIDTFETADNHIFDLQNAAGGIYFLKYNSPKI